MKMTTRVAYCNMRHYKSKNILIGIAIILTTLLHYKTLTTTITVL